MLIYNLILKTRINIMTGTTRLWKIKIRELILDLTQDYYYVLIRGYVE